MESNTYFAELQLDRSGTAVHIDSRPSDAIAIALRLDAPIFANESLLVDPDEEQEMDDASESLNSQIANATDAAQLSADELKEYLYHIRPEDYGQFKL